MPNLWDAAVWAAFFGAIGLPVRAAWARSAPMMWAAALCATTLALLGMYTVGALVFLATCLELGAALALRWRVSASGWAACLLAGFLVWALVVPLQVAGVVWLPWVAAFPAVFATGSLAALILPPRWANGGTEETQP